MNAAGSDRDLLTDLYHAAVRRVDPELMLQERLTLDGDTLTVRLDTKVQHFDLSRFDDIRLLGVGKAGARMARAVESVLGDRIGGGVVVTKRGHGEPLRCARLLEAGHPVPDEASEAAGRAVVEECGHASPRTLFITVVSGGGSALLAAPLTAGGVEVTLADKQETTRLLLGSGATIQELNCIRKHLSALKGGRMAALMHPATSINLILSDVVGDRLDTIASGITAPDTTSFADAITILQQRALWEMVPASVRGVLDAGAGGACEDTPRATHAAFETTHNLLIGSGLAAVQAAEEAARGHGLATRVVSTQLVGEAREVAKVFYAVARDVAAGRIDVASPCCIIAGGETTVTLRGDGTGGRCQEMALAFLAELAEDSAPPDRALFLPAGTDGNDGPTDAAGGFASAEVLRAALAAGLDARAFLARNDAYHYLAGCDALFKPGPTNTNVADVYLLLIR